MQLRLTHLLLVFWFTNINFGLAQQSHRATFNFNQNWKLKIGDIDHAEKADFNDSGWKHINLPYAWNQDEAFKFDITHLSTGIAWYRKTFTLPESSDSKKVFIEFEGVRQLGAVYINGKFVGRHENGVMAFGLDLTQFLNPYPQENVIAVKTDNNWNYKEKLTGSSFQWNNNNFNANYGGIPKNVKLHITPNVYQTLPLFTSLGTEGTYVYASDFDVSKKEATINISTQVKNESNNPVDAQLKVKIKDLQGKQVAAFDGDITQIAPAGMNFLRGQQNLDNLNFWSWGYGYLYTVVTEIWVDENLVDAVSTRTGFRKAEFKDGMVYLNDRVLMMKGYAQRTSNEWPSLGMSVPAWISDYSNKLMVESNANLVRWMHVTPWKQDVESCDRVGLIQAMPAGDSESDVTGRRWDQRLELMRDAIIYNRNNPSILFYESGNESISEAHMAEMLQIKNKYDPNGGRAIGSREMLDSELAEYGGEMLYINKSADIPFWATEYSRDEGLRKYWDEFTPPYHEEGSGGTTHTNVNGTKVKDASAYNHNQDAHAIEDVTRWFDYWEMRPGTGERVSSGGVNIIFSDSNTHYRGQENYRRSGEVDPMRIPKDGFFAHQVIWDGWVETETPQAHIIGHWNYLPKDRVTKDITVVSTANEVELFLNGKSMGRGEQSKRFLFTFKNISFEPGILKAVGYNEAGQVICESQLETAGEPTALKLTKIERPSGAVANGADYIIVQVEVVDKNGKRCPTALNTVDFKVEGEAVFIGGIAQGPNNYIGSKTLPVEGGVNRVFIKTTEKSGETTISATSKGLLKDVLTFNTRKVDLSDLSEDFPSDKLPVNLDFGETPRTSSIKISRELLKIAAIHSTSNENDVWKAVDDNELTQWENASRESSAIQFELEEKTVIDQAVLKLNGWRRKKYPVRITVDDTLVYKGITPLSLGYVTLDLKPVQGKTIQLELMGESESSDEMELVEITGKIDQAGLEDSNASTAKFPIIEVEFYKQNTQ